VTVGLLVRSLREKGWKIATAESCTGGLVAAAITDVAGSSDVFDRGFVTYSNAAKIEMLGVPAELIAKHGAVSAEVAQAMADGALNHSNADLAIAITGIAGPSGGTAEKPVGLVYLAEATRSSFRSTTLFELRCGDLGRAAVRQAAVRQALQLALMAL
jgi:nicotinamide-nucleotide amidase